ncbi:MAG: Ig-like domain-containing protein, partial [Marinicaulis sp.]|nr:Ig-like domain-containing protein [Marinicaulis sp.]
PPPGKGGGGGGGGGGNDTTPPDITNLIPADGATIGTTQTFSAEVTDASGVKSVSFIVDGQSFNGSLVGGDTYEVTLQGFQSGASGTWRVSAKDRAKKGGNTGTSATNSYTVGGGGSGGGIVTNGEWNGGAVQTAAGRILFAMGGSTFVCSGTAATDGTSGRSVIVTAAHCVYDDVAKAFATNVLFIPNQAETTGSGTDSNCNNDPLGCWAPAFGVVEENWANRTFPNNIPWDYAYYVVNDNGSHSGNGSGGALDAAAGALTIDFLPPNVNDNDPGEGSLDWTHALGYSYSEDPSFRYCAEDMTIEGGDSWWLPSCQMSGGSSGGPWVQPMNENTGSGPLMSVNSWGYTNSDGMGGPMLSGTTAQCLFDNAKSASLGSNGVVVDPGTCP